MADPFENLEKNYKSFSLGELEPMIADANGGFCLICAKEHYGIEPCLLYTSPSPRDRTRSRMPSSA